jgi:cell division protein FtsN
MKRKALTPNPAPARARGERLAPRGGHGKSGGGTLVGIFIGLVIGVVGAAGVVWYLNKTPLPFQEKGTKPQTEKPAEPPTPGAAPAPLPGKPGDKVPEKPRFEFYKILPGTEEAAPAPRPETKAEPSAGEALYLQAGAFQSPADADNLKARLALMGVEASVQQVTVPEKGLLHRVRIGPYRSPEDMSKVRTQLAQNGIQATVVRVRDGKEGGR